MTSGSLGEFSENVRRTVRDQDDSLCPVSVVAVNKEAVVVGPAFKYVPFSGRRYFEGIEPSIGDMLKAGRERLGGEDEIHGALVLLRELTGDLVALVLVDCRKAYGREDIGETAREGVDEG